MPLKGHLKPVKHLNSRNLFWMILKIWDNWGRSMGACTVTGTVFKYGVWRVKHRGVAVGLYYGITIIIVSLATAMTVLTLNIHHKGDHGAPVPRLIQKICFDRLLARVLCLRAYKVDEQQDGTAAVCAYMIFLLRVFPFFFLFLFLFSFLFFFFFFFCRRRCCCCCCCHRYCCFFVALVYLSRLSDYLYVHVWLFRCVSELLFIAMHCSVWHRFFS